MKHLVLIQYKFNPNSKEIVYAVETFKKYAQFEYEMYLLGDKCPWLDIPTIEGDHTNLEKYPCRAQHIRVARDLKNACELFKDRYDEFCLMSDDFFCLNNFTWEDICIPKYQGKQIRTVNPYSPRIWAYAKWKTGQFLRKQNLPTVDFTTHCFAVYNIEKLMQIIQTYNLTEPCNDYTIEDLYGNTFWTSSEDIANWRLRIARLATPISCIKQAKENGLKWLNFSENVELNKLLAAVQKFCLDDVPPEENIETEEHEKIVVSMTSYPKRITNVHKAINLIRKYQTVKPDEIHLWLAVEEFPQKEKNLPSELVKMINDNTIILHWVPKNTYAHKSMEIFKIASENDLVILLDDDVRNDDKFIETALKSHQMYPNAIICLHHYSEQRYDGRKNLHKKEGDWSVPRYDTHWCKQSLFPAKLFPMESFNYEDLKEKCSPVLVETWFEPFIVKHNIPIYHCNFGFGKDIDPNIKHTQGLCKYSLQQTKHGLDNRDYALSQTLEAFPEFLKLYREKFGYDKTL